MVMGILQRYARNGKWHKSKGYGFELGRDEARPLSTKRSGRAKFHLGLVAAKPR